MTWDQADDGPYDFAREIAECPDLGPADIDFNPLDDGPDQPDDDDDTAAQAS